MMSFLTSSMQSTNTVSSSFLSLASLTLTLSEKILLFALVINSDSHLGKLVAVFGLYGPDAFNDFLLHIRWLHLGLEQHRDKVLKFDVMRFQTPIPRDGAHGFLLPDGGLHHRRAHAFVVGELLRLLLAEVRSRVQKLRALQQRDLI